MTKTTLIIAVLAAALGQQKAIGVSDVSDKPKTRSTHFEGRCDYRREAANVGPDTGFAECNSVTIIRDGTNSVIDFRRTIAGSEFRYEGALSGDTMTIRRLRIRGRAPRNATGECTIFHRNDRISTVTCVAKVGWKTFAANFVTSRLNPND
jgi:hypothetical protein